MSLLEKIFGKTKTLSQLSPAELRKEEILIGKAKDKLLGKIETIANDKKRLFDQGAKTTSPELRKALAGEFELKTREQLLASRELNIRSKELLTVSRVRLVKEHQNNTRALGRLNIGERDFVKITQWIEDDAVNQEMYVERLDELLALGEQSDRDVLGATSLGEAGSELMNLWDRLDKGEVKQDEALSAAEEAVRKRAERQGG
jgi:hypothetical protein